MAENNNSQNEEKIKNKRMIFWGLFILLVCIDIIILTIESSIFSVGVIGIFTFIWILISLNYLTGDPKICEGEVRKAITITFIVVYLAIFSLSTNTNISNSYNGMFQIMIDHFTYLVGIVIAFYFGSTTAEKFRKKN